MTIRRNSFLLILFLVSSLSVATFAEESTAREMADTHYQLVVAGEEEAWAKTFIASDYELYTRAKENGISGHVLEGRWRSARRRAKNGVTWVYLRQESSSETEVKFFYKRVDGNGKQVGYPVPIRLVKEGDLWKVSGVTY